MAGRLCCKQAAAGSIPVSGSFFKKLPSVSKRQGPLAGACDEADRMTPRAQVVDLAGVPVIGAFPERLV